MAIDNGLPSTSDLGPDDHQIAMSDKITYEQPLNERIRTFLRLEFLFKQARAHHCCHSIWDSRAALMALFDILNVFSRADLKNDIMKEMERQAGLLELLVENPHVDRRRLEAILNKMDPLIDTLHAMQGQTGQELRQNEFLNTIKQRASIAGGTCDFDLPAYHKWLSQTEEQRTLELQQWLQPLDAIQQSINLILRLIRDSAPATQERAVGGFFQKSLDPSQTCQLVRVTMAKESPCFAEISGGKHRFSIRLMVVNSENRPTQTDDDIDFELTCCTL